MRSTRSVEKKRKLDEGIVEEPKPKIMTLGIHLALIRQEEENKLLENESIAKYEQFENYSKEAVIADLNAAEVNSALFGDKDFYQTKDSRILFLTLKTGANPARFTHLCNNSSMKWSLEHLKIPSSASYGFGLPSVVMVFVRGEFVEGTTKKSEEYKYLGE